MDVSPAKEEEGRGRVGMAGLKMYFWAARNSASCLPPSPSSLTIVPAVRAWRSATASTAVQAPLRPTSSESMPRSDRSRDSTRLLLWPP